MKTFATYLLAALCALAASALAPSGAQAAVILDISPEGKLLGARNVDVGGTLYDVTFQAGSCVALFDGCDENSDFTFQNDAATALLAAAVLSETVFLDSALGNFDSEPLLTNGCTYQPHQCLIIIPYNEAGPGVEGVEATAFRNMSSPDLDEVTGLGPSKNNALSFPYAVFTPAVASVPEPASALLLGAGLIGWIGLRRRGGQANPRADTVGA